MHSFEHPRLSSQAAYGIYMLTDADHCDRLHGKQLEHTGSGSGSAMRN